MIQIKNLTKIFNSKKKNKCVAVNDVTVDLPDKGFVFVIGKSGSGKTTLLSLIGGLDKFNSGEINVNGVNLSTLKGRKFDYYRNDTIGFIFQDFQLFDYLTVAENIKLGLDFKNDKDYEKIHDVLKSVDLEGFEDRYPKQLSGGEKQRVAIARVLVKNPSVILADEPTGNLDPETTKKVLEILRSIAKERLVLIVSHNILDAHEFADYILELHEGKLIGTYKRNDENIKSIELSNGILRLPLHKEIIDSEKELLLKNLKNGVKEIVQDDKDFSPIILKNPAEPALKCINKKHISFKNAFKRGLHFIKNSLVTMFVFSLVTATLFALINASQAIRDISYDKTIRYDIANHEGDYSFFVNWKDTKDKRFMTYEMDPNVLNEISKTGYKGKIYKAYNCDFATSNPYVGLLRSYPSKVVVCEEEYLENRFQNVEKVIESKNIYPYGLYITDYFVDSINNIFASRKKPYESYLGFKAFPNYPCYINGIIKTDYKEKYKEFLPYIFNRDLLSEGLTVKLISVNRKLYDEYLIDLNYYFNNYYSFNENFIEDYLNTNFEYKRGRYIDIFLDDKLFSKDRTAVIYGGYSKNTISSNFYYELTGKNIQCDSGKYISIEPLTLKFDVYTREDSNGNKIKKPYELTFERVGRPNYGSSTEIHFLLNKNDPAARQLSEDVMFSMNGFILDNTANLKAISELDCLRNIVLYDNVTLSAELADRLGYVFNKIFGAIMVGLILCCIISLTFYGFYLVKKNKRMIGICKSLGARTFDMLVILTLNLIVTIGLTLLLYSGLAFAFVGIFEMILKEALIKSTIYQISISYKILFTNFGMYFGLMGVILFFSIVSFVALFIKINKLKPLELIKSEK